jgi:hypothetical protein
LDKAVNIWRRDARKTIRGSIQETTEVMRIGSYRALSPPLIVCAVALACGQTDAVFVDVSATADTLIVTAQIDPSMGPRSDTIVGPPDTVVIAKFDTLFSPRDTVLRIRLDTLFSPDTVFVTTIDTIVSGTDTTLVTTVDTLAVQDTVVIAVVDTIVSIDTVVVATVDTVVIVDTIVVVDTVNVTTTLVTSVSSLTLNVGQTAALSVTAKNPLGYAWIPAQVTWLSDAPAVASVSETGRLRAMSPGQANIHALTSGLSVTVPTTVVDTAASLPLPRPPGSAYLFHSDW